MKMERRAYPLSTNDLKLKQKIWNVDKSQPIQAKMKLIKSLFSEGLVVYTH